MAKRETPVRVGQVWESRDPRDNGRRVSVVTVDGYENGYATTKGLVNRIVRKSTLRTRYRLVRDA